MEDKSTASITDKPAAVTVFEARRAWLERKQLGRHCNGDHLRLLAVDARQANRTGDAVDLLGAKAALLQTVAESGPFGLAANQPDKRQITVFAQTAQTGDHDVEVFCMTETHDEHMAARGEVGYRSLHRIGVLAFDAFGHVVRENFIATVDPAHGKRQWGQRADQRTPDMPPAKERQWTARRDQLPSHPLGIIGADLLETQRHDAAAALTQAGTQHMADMLLRSLACQHAARVRDGLQFEVPSPDRGRKTICKDKHACSAAARHGALHVQHSDKNSRLLAKQVQSTVGRDQVVSCCKIEGRTAEDGDTIRSSGLRNMQTMNTPTPLCTWQRAAVAIAAGLLLAILQACSLLSQSGNGAPLASQARNAREYRHAAASHLYARYSDRIYRGRLPPMLYAVGVLNVDIDRQGRVKAIRWQRAPQHAPEVMAKIEKMVRDAAPYPSPTHMSQVTYTDVWLWHQSGRFQLDTLTEGQD